MIVYRVAQRLRVTICRKRSGLHTWMEVGTMAQFHKPIAASLWLAAVVIVFWSIFSPLLDEWFGDSIDVHVVWTYLDPLTAIGAVIVLIYTWRRGVGDVGAGNQAVTRDWLAHTTLFFVVAFLLLLLAGNYVVDSILGTMESGGYRSLIWVIINAGMPLSFLAVGTLMWRDEG